MLESSGEYFRQTLLVSFSQRANRENPPISFRAFNKLCDYLTLDDSPSQSELVFVLAGRPERKAYGLRLFREGIALRIVLSVGRFEVRKMDAFGFQDLNLREMVKHMAPIDRHFFVEISDASRSVTPAKIKRVGTFGELAALSAYLANRQIKTLTLISTSVHLRRVRLCCRKISGLRGLNISYVPVPEELSSFQRERWWKRLDQWIYICSEYIKLLAYQLRFRHDRNE
jgi:hypothetical protein